MSRTAAPCGTTRQVSSRRNADRFLCTKAGSKEHDGIVQNSRLPRSPRRKSLHLHGQIELPAISAPPSHNDVASNSPYPNIPKNSPTRQFFFPCWGSWAKSTDFPARPSAATKKRGTTKDAKDTKMKDTKGLSDIAADSQDDSARGSSNEAVFVFLLSRFSRLSWFPIRHPVGKSSRAAMIPTVSITDDTDRRKTGEVAHPCHP